MNMRKYIVIAFNGRFQVTQSEARRVLKSDIRNCYEWRSDECQVLIWGTDEYVPGDGLAIQLVVDKDY
jgi:hypothetical protein